MSAVQPLDLQGCPTTRLYLAPIQGMTVACYRNAYARIFGGIDEYYSPFLSTTDPRSASPSLWKDLLPERNDAAVKLVPQLLGNDGADFRYFAAILVDLGYREINWNIGCPFPMVTHKKKGSGLLPYPREIRKFLDAVCSDSSFTLTVKMRLGLEDPEEGMDVLRVLNDYPLGGVILHARTGSQMYTGTVDLDSFEALAAVCRHELTYNGDIFTVEDFHRIRARFPAINCFMLGRGALNNPFLPSTLKGYAISEAERLRKFQEFHDEIFRYYQSTLSGDRHLCDKMKSFWSYLSVSLKPDSKQMKKLQKSQTAADYLVAANNILRL